MLAGLVILAIVTGTSNAGASNAQRAGATAPANSLSAGIRDPMNPEAYMRDLAARMKPADQKMLLRGSNAPRVGPASQVPIVQSAPVVQSGAGEGLNRGVPASHTPFGW